MKITAPHRIIDAPIALPSSKSISNRLLIIQALSKQGEIKDLSEAEDTTVLEKMLKETPSIMDVGHAGTAFRFLTAYLSMTEGEYVLTGSDRMKNRPIGILVDALRKLGADIQYTDKDGFPPLKIVGKPLQGGNISIKSNVSSQFISALMMIAPYMRNGLNINLVGDIVSQSYIEMTASLMRSCGVEIIYDASQIQIPHGEYKFESIIVEKDWSAASFWYELVLLGELKHLLLEGVKKESIQGDVNVSELFANFGVQSRFDDLGLHLSYTTPFANNLPRIVDFKNTPDLIQPFVVSLAAKNEQYVITGSRNLTYKETDRAQALKMELAKFGAYIDVADDSILVLKGVADSITKLEVETYQDHRMAMSFAPLAVIYGELEIVNPDVVQKSYPDYWNQLVRIGFTID